MAEEVIETTTTEAPETQISNETKETADVNNEGVGVVENEYPDVSVKEITTSEIVEQ